MRLAAQYACTHTHGGVRGYLPHDECPMAQAIKLAKPLRGAYADAERPDGTRVRFTPFPTPLFIQRETSSAR